MGLKHLARFPFRLIQTACSESQEVVHYVCKCFDNFRKFLDSFQAIHYHVKISSFRIVDSWFCDEEQYLGETYTSKNIKKTFGRSVKSSTRISLEWVNVLVS